MSTHDTRKSNWHQSMARLGHQPETDHIDTVPDWPTKTSLLVDKETGQWSLMDRTNPDAWISVDRVGKKTIFGLDGVR